MKCFFGFHDYVVQKGSWRKTGDVTMDWAGNIVPEYQEVRICSRCGKSIVDKYIVFGEKELE